MSQIMEDFYEEFFQNTHIFEDQTSNSFSDKINKVQIMQNILTKIDPSLHFRIKLDIIELDNYDFPGSFVEYTKKMKVVRYNLELSCSGSFSKMSLLNELHEMSDNYIIPDNWIIVKYFTEQNNPEGSVDLIKFGKDRFVGINNFSYNLKTLKESVFIGADERIVQQNISIYDKLSEVKKLFDNITINDLYDLTIVFPDDLLQFLHTQEDIYEIRNSVLDWIESILGEYLTAIQITRFTVIPQAGYEMQLKDIITLKHANDLRKELTRIHMNVKHCKLCKLAEYNVKLLNTPIFDTLEHPYINGLLCEYCIKILLNFKPMYDKITKKINSD
jgi:hypothetical protein